jgi:hypothetical protein
MHRLLFCSNHVTVGVLFTRLRDWLRRPRTRQLVNHPELREIITEEDEQALGHLVAVMIEEYSDTSSGFRFQFVRVQSLVRFSSLALAVLPSACACDHPIDTHVSGSLS